MEQNLSPEETNVKETETTQKNSKDGGTPKKETKTGDGNKTLEQKFEELQDKFNEMMIENAKLKRLSDKNSSEAADWKKKYRSTQSEKEVLDAEKAEAEAMKDERLKELERKDKIHDFTESFMDLGYSKEDAKKAATAQVDGDTEVLLALQKEFTKAQVEAEKQKILSEMPQPNIGVGGTGKQYTKEEFDRMSMQKRTELKRENKAEYDRLLNL